MSYHDECCYGEHEDFDIIVTCPNLCGAARQRITIHHCGQEPPRTCRCGAPLHFETARS